MAKQSSALFFLTLFAYLFSVAVATPLVRLAGEDIIEFDWDPSGFEYPAVEFPRLQGPRVVLGYNGFNGDVRANVQASVGGELGAVFYIADVST